MDAYRRVRPERKTELKDGDFAVRSYRQPRPTQVSRKLGLVAPAKPAAQAEGGEAAADSEAKNNDCNRQALASGFQIAAAIELAVSIKQRAASLFQLNKIGTEEVTTVYEPLYEGLRTITEMRTIPTIEITSR